MKKPEKMTALQEEPDRIVDAFGIGRTERGALILLDKIVIDGEEYSLENLSFFELVGLLEAFKLAYIRTKTESQG